ncbi:chitin synthase III catalytic subunit [Triangularia verruculosa]|uniref:Chitin synthase III catalytic subunit n=1 Tax=Triangularia verruculosa TaxID=2587418 RepID=A0AAN6XL28_9PEZI|nr:chitin synthase III catalytic subunit [Triangularia verruculosa]
MGSTKFGNFEDFCRDTTLPVCNVLSETHNQDGPWGGCKLRGIALPGEDRYLGNLGSILLAGVAIFVTLYLIYRSERKRAAVGRREMQLFLVGYLLVSIAEIFSIGEFPLNDQVRVVFSAIHIGAIAATTWLLFINGIVGYQLMDDGTILSLALTIGSALAWLIGVGYIALDTGYQWTTQWQGSLEPPNRSIALYVTYLLLPLIWVVFYVVLELVLVIKVLGETRPLLHLGAAALSFAVGQIFNFVVSPYICNGTTGAIDGSLFQTLFTLVSVGLVWFFWSSITEDDWPMPVQPYP